MAHERPQPIPWSSAFEVGIPEIDQDHRLLVTVYNDLVRALERPVSLTTRQHFAATVSRFLRAHMRREETYLERLNHRLVAEHLQQHERCELAIADLDTRVANGLCMVTVAELLHEWIIEHVLASDRKLFASLHETEQPSIPRAAE